MGEITSTEAAKELGVVRERIIALIHEGRIKARRPGRDWLIDAKAFRKFAATYDRTPGPKPKRKKGRR